MDRYVRVVPLAALALVGCGGAATESQLLARASHDLGCGEQSLDVVEIDDRTRGVQGCNRRATYIATCETVPYVTRGYNGTTASGYTTGKCTWVREPDPYGPPPAPVAIPAQPTKPRAQPAERAPSPGPSAAAKAPSPGVTLPYRGGDVVPVGGGKATIGSTLEPDERPVHEVTLKPFGIDRTEVTVLAYAECVAAGACTATDTATGCNGALEERARHPINCVSQPQAAAFCAWAGKRLPTEEEWEHAARGAEARRYPWGEAQPSSQACWSYTRKDATCEVDGAPRGRTPEGVADLAGNVLEWTASKYCSYPDNRCDSEKVVTRGGSFATNSDFLRSARRTAMKPGARTPFVGFRCAVDAPAAPPTAKPGEVPPGIF